MTFTKIRACNLPSESCSSKPLGHGSSLNFYILSHGLENSSLSENLFIGSVGINISLICSTGIIKEEILGYIIFFLYFTYLITKILYKSNNCYNNWLILSKFWIYQIVLTVIFLKAKLLI